MKILFTSVGRRVELMQSFHNAAEKLGIVLTIIGADATLTAPALLFCDIKKIVPRISNPEYIPELLRICHEEKVDCLIPTIDTDLLLLAENKKEFEEIGTRVLISSAEKVRICRDQRFTADYFTSLGLKSPLPVDKVEKYDFGFPAFIKPKDGSSSIDAYKIHTLEDLYTYADRIGDYIIQPYISGKEFTVDIFCDYEGNPAYITPRERIAVRAGEVLKTQICQDKTIIEEMKKLVADFKPCGQITVQLIREEATGEDYYIEINPRFGGGAPLSMKAGADSAEAVIKMLSGKKLEYMAEAAADGAIYSRFDQSVCIAEGKRKQSVLGVIFDIDDTLYSEKQYVRSGYNAVAKLLGNEAFADRLWTYFENGKPAIDELLNELGRMERKKECLEMYREHVPEIRLYDGVVDLILELKSKGIKVGVITDGRVSGQKRKLQALDLDKLVDDIIITDELGGTQFRKPCDIAFRIMVTKWRLNPSDIVYVGDNPAKDFQAPRQLGMRRICFKNPDGLYSANVDSDVVTINSIPEVCKWLEC